MATAPLVFWHGSHRWDGQPEVRAANKRSAFLRLPLRSDDIACMPTKRSRKRPAKTLDIYVDDMRHTFGGWTVSTLTEDGDSPYESSYYDTKKEAIAAARSLREWAKDDDYTDVGILVDGNLL